MDKKIEEYTKEQLMLDTKFINESIKNLENLSYEQVRELAFLNKKVSLFLLEKLIDMIPVDDNTK